MNAKNLPLKFAVVALLVVFCLWSLWSRGLRQGIDLRGGHSLIFEIRTHHAEIKRLQADQAELEKALQAATDKQEKKQLQDHILRIKADLRRYEQDSVEVSDLARRMIATLKNRVDPQGLRSLEWRPLGNRIEVRMPAGSQESQDAKNAYQLALERLEAGNVRQSQIRRVIQATGQQRSDEIAKLAADDSSAQRLAVLAAASDAMNQARRDVRQAEEKLNAAQLAGKKTESLQQTLEKAQAKLDDLTVDYEKHLRAVRDGNVSAQRLQRILENYVSRQEADAIDNRKEVARRMELFTSAIEKLRSRYSARRGDIDQVVAAYKDWARTRQELDDPADLERLIAKAGVLEYRIAPYSPESDAPDFKLTASERDRYVKNLLEEGPEGLRRRNERLLWFPIHGEREGYGSLVTADYAGKQYVLLYNQPGFTMLRETGLGGWSLARAQPTRDERMRPAVGFDFDEAGAKRFHNLTTAHKGHVLAVLLDDEVYSAPVIRTAISKRGTITGTFTPEEVNELVRILDAGSLPAKLNPKPVAVNTFGPAIGAVNKELGIRAAVWGLIAVAVFMLIYYQKAGLIADVALLLNMIFVLGTMSLLNAVFTLPGIAGLILTIGMAVDANVLIFERLREEQAKGISIRMALKNAYERAFSAIVDANITTMLVCLILGWVGTEEVRGFAITLGLGVAFSMFTSLVVTRWIFQLLLEMRLLKKSVFMLKLVGIPKINWMSKRHFFWGLTIIFMAMGIGSLAVQGRDIWGIEFSSGAQAIIPLEDDTLLEGKLPNDKAVREDFIAAAAKLGYDKLAATARVETQLNPNRVRDFLRDHDPSGEGRVTRAKWLAAKHNPEFFDKIDTDKDGLLSRDELKSNLPASSYQVSTTDMDVDHIRRAADEAFGESLVIRTRCRFKITASGQSQAMGVPIAANGATRINKRLWRRANQAYRDELEDNADGVMFVMRDVRPNITCAELRQRIREMRFQPDYAGQLLHKTTVIGLQPAGEGYESFAILVRPADTEAIQAPGAWEKFAEQERKLVELALGREEAMVATKFDAAIAGETANRAIFAVIVSWLAIVGYLWLRFGTWRWGAAAVVCLIHDTVIVIGLVAVSGWLCDTLLGQTLMIRSFKIDLAMVAAALTVIGYSVNDTIVVFDRIRENRGKLTAVSPLVINTSINQTLARTLLTSGTTFIVVLIMYVWGGPGIHAFNYALLVGILFGTYSSVAVASPLLMGLRKALVARTAGAVAE